MTRPFGRRAGLLALLAGLSACATAEPPAPAPVAPIDPEPERVYSPGAIPWTELSDEHKRRARAGLARMGDPIDEDETLQARWMIMSPAQQRFLIRRPPPPPPARPARTTRSTRSTRSTRTAPQRSRSAPAPARRTTPPPRRRTNQSSR